MRHLRVAVVGCGMSPVGAGLGSEIDGHDLVIRANRAYDTAGKEADWGCRTDVLCVGNLAILQRFLPNPCPFEIVEVDKVWKGIWPHVRRPLTGTYAALHASRLGATAITLYGIDLYADAPKVLNKAGPTVFKRHSGLPPNWRWSADLDRDALLNLPCPVEWRLRRS